MKVIKIDKCLLPILQYADYTKTCKERMMKKISIMLVLLCISLMMVSGAGAREQASPQKKVTLNVMMSFTRFTEQMEAYSSQFEAKMLKERGSEVVV